MYKYFCLNPISPVGLEKFSDDYVPAGEMAGADAVLVRSAGMHELEFDKDLKEAVDYIRRAVRTNIRKFLLKE